MNVLLIPGGSKKEKKIAALKDWPVN
jgi:hypothetical protein